MEMKSRDDSVMATNVTRMSSQQQQQVTIAVSNNNNSARRNDLHTYKMQATLELKTPSSVVFPATPTTTPTKHCTPAAAATTPNGSPPDFDFSIPCRYFKSSFARSLSLNNACSNSSSNHCKSLDFEINNQRPKTNGPPLPQRLSRAGTTNGNAKNEVNTSNSSSGNDVKPPPALPAKRSLPPIAAVRNLQSVQTHQKQQQSSSSSSLTQFRRAGNTNSFVAATVAATSETTNGHFNKIIKQQKHQHQQQQQQNNSNIFNNNNNNNSCDSDNDMHYNNIRNHIDWPHADDNCEQDCNLCADEAAEKAAATGTIATAMPAYVTTTATAATMTMEQQQHQQQQQQPMRPQFELHENAAATKTNVEAVILQNQVDTLQWQLKQVETSCEMYRAVMEEVSRFLDRFNSQKREQQEQRQLEHNNLEQMSRSKSLYQVYDDERREKTAPSPDLQTAYLRARSSTNLIDHKPTSKSAKVASSSEHHYEDITAANSYSAFKDFTWRRSPKRNSRTNTPLAAAEEKLNQEAFRLSRTIHNLLNTSTQQPDLTQHRNSLNALSLGRLCKTPSASTMTLHMPLHNSTSLSMAPTTAHNGTDSSASVCSLTATKMPAVAAAEMLFLRSATMRDSRLSLRSSTDNSSVHSTTSSAASSSSKVETDDEPPTTAAFQTPALRSCGGSNNSSSNSSSKQMPPLCSSATEDESGFSSINSFQDIGVPLSSTLLSTAGHVGRQLSGVHDCNIESRNSTLKASMAASSNEVGVPLHETSDMQHRWDLPSKTTYRNANKLQRFSTLSNEDSATVLWV